MGFISWKQYKTPTNHHIRATGQANSSLCPPGREKLNSAPQRIRREVEISPHSCRHQRLQAPVLLVPEGISIGLVHSLHHLPHALLVLGGAQLPGNLLHPHGQQLTLGWALDALWGSGSPRQRPRPRGHRQGQTGTSRDKQGHWHWPGDTLHPLLPFHHLLPAHLPAGTFANCLIKDISSPPSPMYSSQSSHYSLLPNLTRF